MAPVYKRVKYKNINGFDVPYYDIIDLPDPQQTQPPTPTPTMTPTLTLTPSNTPTLTLTTTEGLFSDCLLLEGITGTTTGGYSPNGVYRLNSLCHSISTSNYVICTCAASDSYWWHETIPNLVLVRHVDYGDFNIQMSIVELPISEKEVCFDTITVNDVYGTLHSESRDFGGSTGFSEIPLAGTYQVYYGASPTGYSGETYTLSYITCPTPTATATPTQETQTPTPSQTLTYTPKPTSTPTLTKSEKLPTPTPTETFEITKTAQPTQTLTKTSKATQTPTPTITETATQTPTETPTYTPKPTETPTQTLTQTNTQTNTQTETIELTKTAAPTQTLTQSSKATQTPTPTLTLTQTPTLTLTPSSGGCYRYVINNNVPSAVNIAWTDCDGNSSGAAVFPYNSPYYVCSIITPFKVAGSSDYTIEIYDYNCDRCSPCEEYTIVNNDKGLPLGIVYYDCDNWNYTNLTVGVDSSTTICSCQTPTRINGSTDYTITLNGLCPL